jgi:hypothetical protein
MDNKGNIIIIARDYPNPGGRVSNVNHIIEALNLNFCFKVISWNNAPNSLTVRKYFNDSTFSLYTYYLQTFISLWKLKGSINIDLIFTLGLSGLGGVLFGKLFSIPVYHNTSGYRAAIKTYNKTTNGNNTVVTNKTIHINKFLRYIKNYKGYLRVFADKLPIIWCDKLILPSEFNKIDIERRGIDLSSHDVVIIEEGVGNKSSQNSVSNIAYKMDLDLHKKTICFARIEDDNTKLNLYYRLSDKYNVLIIDPKDILMHKNNKMIKTSFKIEDVFLVSDLLVVAPTFEPHSSTVLEALVLDLPVLVTQTGWLEYEFKEYPELLIEYSNVDLIVYKITDFFANRDKYLKIIASAKKNLLSKYNLEKCINSYTRIFNNL